MANGNVDRLKALGMLAPDVSLDPDEKNAIDQLTEQEMKQIEGLQGKISGQLTPTDTRNIQNWRNKLGPAARKVFIPTWF